MTEQTKAGPSMNTCPCEPGLAKAIVHKLGSFGTPPEFGIEYFSVGLESYLEVIEHEYLDGMLKYNLSSFKLITGNYGGGKTHLLYMIRQLAWKHNYATSYVSLSPTECPFDRLELVYKKIVSNITPPAAQSKDLTSPDIGIESLVRHVYEKYRGERDLVSRIKSLESSSYANALKGAFLSLKGDDEEEYDALTQWLKGEDIPREIRLRYRISERINRSTAFRMLRSLVQFINSSGYAGFILLFDEAERGMSISSTRDRRRALDNLRQLVDECGNSRLPGAMFFYAVPDENLLLEGSGGVYEALKQRLRSTFTRVNPMGVKINLEEIGVTPEVFLQRLGEKLLIVFQCAYGIELENDVVQESLKCMIEASIEMQSLDVSYRRIFVIGIIEAFHRIKENHMVIGYSDAQLILRSTVKMLAEKEKEAVEQEEF
ncbi:MAG: DUF2791 family P-loop domain-containing protein [candidate division WOR-3 bacterium]|nr:MAG: DUF2791 family P-loop domain-containing protein [candidate division WOR-3 bacterium]